MHVFRPPMPGKIAASVWVILLLLLSLLISTFVGMTYLPVVILIFLALLLFPLRIKYSLDKDGITITGILRKKRIRLSDLKSARPVPTSEVVRLRLAGIALPGYLVYGLFTGNVGRVWVYATKILPTVILLETFKDDRIVISPKDVEAFLKQLEKIKR